ncbi:glycine cleavage system protein T [Aliifodinibius salipaludis]|uniref:Aminomethyltransferase n=1 Tax=Fodinibius salipaludis TaxID=2032627 RepID=A0A2A2GDQ0_9BACT|nr:glycine cleavage system aminomethyltransferase GcvT [Aliifodinibius salipaludis]PAU95310.1 glycine cleavage system protein T [Aliifodinibius salipaludis]
MLKRTPFYNLHEQAGAKLIDFGGFEMPVQYESIRKEHNAVREKVGMFDVSHMGEFYVTGDEALDLIQYVTINDVSNLVPGKAQYSAMCYEDGGIVDDLLIYMLGENEYMLVVNASNIDKDFEWIAENNSFDAELTDISEDTCLLAVQGPKSVETLQKLTDTDLSAIKFYTFELGKLAGFDDVTLSATGYTGEKGFELYFNKNNVDSEAIWKAIMEAGEEFGIEPCGLGARDTLRLEKGFALYGNDITKDTHPLEARMGWLTKLDKGEFMGRDALVKAKEEGLSRKLVGLTIDDKRSIPRKGYTIFDEEDNEIGFVTSGSRSITLGTNIAMGYVDIGYADEGSSVFVEIRNKKAEAAVTKPPFVK